MANTTSRHTMTASRGRYEGERVELVARDDGFVSWSDNWAAVPDLPGVVFKSGGPGTFGHTDMYLSSLLPAGAVVRGRWIVERLFDSPAPMPGQCGLDAVEGWEG